MKTRLLSAVAAAIAVSGVVAMSSPVAGAAESDVTCDNWYLWKVIDAAHGDHVTVYENENWEAENEKLVTGTLVRGKGDERPSGFTPVQQFRTSTQGWTTLLEGGNDVNDFIRSSGLIFYSCG